MNALIRPAEEQDADVACEVLLRSITECCSEDHADDPIRLAPWLENKTPENLRHWIGDPGSHAFVAEADGGIVGVGMMLSTGEITLCYLVPEVRFTGVGKALLAELESKARELGLRQLSLNSTQTASAFYIRNGFEPAGTADSWHGIECYPMVKVLGARS